MEDWTNPISWGATPITVDLLNEQIRDNTEHLKDPPTDDYTQAYGATSIYSTTSSTFVDVHSDFVLSLATYGGDILVCLIANMFQQVAFDFTVNGSRQGGIDGLIASNISDEHSQSFHWLLTDIPAGEYEIVLQWKKLTGASISSDDKFPFQFWAREIS